MKRSIFPMIVAALAVALVLPRLAEAHHGQAAYNTTSAVTVVGTVTDFQFVNPHVLIYMDVKNNKGETEKWQGELTSPNHLLRVGWTRSSLKPGDQITMTGYPAKNGATSMWISKILLANGTELKAGGGN